jgi:hypothetical protein
MVPQAHLGLRGDLHLIAAGLEGLELDRAYLNSGITAVVTEGQTELKVGRLTASPENPVIDGRLLGSDSSVFHHPHPGHPFPTAQVLAIEDQGEALFNFGSVK